MRRAYIWSKKTYSTRKHMIRTSVCTCISLVGSCCYILRLPNHISKDCHSSPQCTYLLPEPKRITDSAHQLHRRPSNSCTAFLAPMCGFISLLAPNAPGLEPRTQAKRSVSENTFSSSQHGMFDIDCYVGLAQYTLQ